jgi:DNA-binding FadR family transcriptional regulator
VFVAAVDPVVELGRTLLSVQGEPLAVAGAIEVREQLDPLVATHAATHRTDADSRELEALIAQMGKSLDDVTKFVHLTWSLHIRIAAISPNTVLRGTYGGLYEFVNRVSLVNSQPRDTVYLTQRLRVHSELVAAIVAGDVDAAQRAAVTHRH